MKTQKKKQTLRPPHKSTAAHKLPSITGRHKFIIYVPGHITVCTCHHVEFALTIVGRFIFPLLYAIQPNAQVEPRCVSLWSNIILGNNNLKGLTGRKQRLSSTESSQVFHPCYTQFVRRGEKAFSVGFLSYLHKWRNYRPKKTHTQNGCRALDDFRFDRRWYVKRLIPFFEGWNVKKVEISIS